MGKSYCDVTILTTESIENRTHFRFLIELRLCFRLKWTHGTILVESELDEKSDGKSYRLTIPLTAI